MRVHDSIEFVACGHHRQSEEGGNTRHLLKVSHHWIGTYIHSLTEVPASFWICSEALPRALRQ